MEQQAIHVWIVEIHQHLDSQAELRATEALSLAEREKLTRFQIRSGKNQFLQTRYYLRQILARYSGLSACDLQFEASLFGKPSLLASTYELKFNLSHSGKYLVIAISKNIELGIDVEESVDTDTALRLSKYSYSQNERQYLRTIEIVELQKAFLEVWTLKEAFSKAKGLGFQMDWKCFSVQFQGNQTVQLLDNSDALNPYFDWHSSVFTFEPTDMYRLAICSHRKCDCVNVRYVFFDLTSETLNLSSHIQMLRTSHAESESFGERVISVYDDYRDLILDAKQSIEPRNSASALE
jgi:4'-phosphopantetheinyl transferase